MHYRTPSKRSKRTITRATAYLITQEGANKLLKLAYPIRMPADYLTGALQLTGLNAYGVEPLVYFEVSILKLMQWSNANNEIKK